VGTVTNPGHKVDFDSGDVATGALSQPRVVAIGGGNGLPMVLRGLKEALFPEHSRPPLSHDRDYLTAIVTVADDGGSSGRLRQAYGILPPGDIRNCLLALADEGSTLAALFGYRFDGSGDVAGHSLGNLILTALDRLEQDFPKAVERGSEILGVRGRVFPVTTDDVRLRAQYDDGSSIEGESKIALSPRTIRKVLLEPPGPQVLSGAVEAARRADIVVIGPGSLYTSLIPVLLVKELVVAVRLSGARVMLVMNLTTEPGETDGYTAADHLMAIRRHAPDLPIHDVLLNSTPLPEELGQQHEASGAAVVPSDFQLLRALGCRPIEGDLLGSGPRVRHDPQKLAKTILGLVREGGFESIALKEGSRLHVSDACVGVTHTTGPSAGLIPLEATECESR
jgi:uncharacterized cofD-like protein